MLGETAAEDIMGYLEKLARSADLVQGMARRVGADLTEHVDLRGDGAALDFREIVLRCAGCPEQAACARLQAETERLSAAPDYCRNAHLMRLRRT